MKLAGIQYMGVAGISRECKDAVMRLLQFGDQINSVHILTSRDSNALIISINNNDLVAIKSGFSSGHPSEGSRTFSYILQLLETKCEKIYEHEVDNALIERLDHSALTFSDIEKIKNSHHIPGRWHNYIFEDDFNKWQNGTLWNKFPPVIPFAIIDNRISDLALSFWKNPDYNIFTGYRRLEDILRNRIQSNEHGTKLFNQSFHGEKPKLQWKGLDKGEQAGRANLFISSFAAHRNSRAHRETNDKYQDELSEFLLLNHLYRLEKEASEV